jgi:hypothetical protein
MPIWVDEWMQILHVHLFTVLLHVRKVAEDLVYGGQSRKDNFLLSNAFSYYLMASVSFHTW